MRRSFPATILILCATGLAAQGNSDRQSPRLFPPDNAVDVNPDTHLVLTFSSEPTLGTSGQVRIYDAANDRLVDILDLSIPPGPTVRDRREAPYTPTPYAYPPDHFTNANTRPGTPSGAAAPTSTAYQLTIIGGFTDAFHFYPIIIHGRVATIYLHNNLLEYGRTYYAQIDRGVLRPANDSSFSVAGRTGWSFTTKKTPPNVEASRFVVSGDGTGDFNTVQGAVDFIPDRHPGRVTVFIRNGTYEEIVYFRNKTDITFLGEDRDSVIVCYPNNEVFNPHPANVATNEMPGTFPSRRAVFMADHSTGIYLLNFTLKSTAARPGQAEGLLLAGGRDIVSNVTVDGSGDALQVNDPVYLVDSRIVGDGDIVLGRGPAFFDHCELVTRSGPFMWIRNTQANHGNVFLHCTFRNTGPAGAVIARAPTNRGKNYPYCEAVLLNCALEGVSPEGWGPVGGDTSNVHYWEYNSTNISDGMPVDVTHRRTYSRQLNKEEDAAIIADYGTPAYVLGGWQPGMAPVILRQPAPVSVEVGQNASFGVQAAAIPPARYQWFKNGTLVTGASDASLRIENVRPSDAGTYTATATNSSGSVNSISATLQVR